MRNGEDRGSVSGAGIEVPIQLREKAQGIGARRELKGGRALSRAGEHDVPEEIGVQRQ